MLHLLFFWDMSTIIVDTVALTSTQIKSSSPDMLHLMRRYNRPPEHPNLHVSSISPLPKSYTDAFNGPNWQNAMQDEYNVFNKNNTWTLMPRPTDANIARCMWSFHHKYLADGTLSCYKARLVANGSTQIDSIDVDETFSPVVKPGTIRTVLSLATSQHWPVHQLDVKNAFLHGDLAETVYMYQPLGFRDSTHPDYVCLLERQGSDTAYQLLYVDDIVLTASFETLLQQIIASLHREFSMTDLGSLNYFLGSLQYLTFTRLDISYAVQQMRIRLVVLLLDDQLQVIVAEAKYRGIANAIAETCWLRNLLRELHTPLYSATLVYCDNVSAVYLSSNSVQHQRTKHIEIDIHFVRDLVAAGQVRVLHIPSHYQIMPPKMMKRKAVKKIVKKQIAEAIEEYEKTKANPGNAGGSGPTIIGGTVNVQGCSHKTFMNGKPHPFNGTKGVIGLSRWIEKVEQVFEICKCAEEDKVMFVASTLRVMR
ncbi:ribonuclease H-like domain-containing protein [Tanacetum coccineum]|uniref:Ribonuclease H-like domain-containing protein n=1 Tax=Tanacetum coccineum TaxID=301880 RepID=A0ABQ5C437_9ASTR